MGSWQRAGAFEVWIPDGPVRPGHEHQAVGIAGTSVQRIKDPVTGQVRLAFGCSRADWRKFVNAVKAGRFDTKMPDS